MCAGQQEDASDVRGEEGGGAVMMQREGEHSENGGNVVKRVSVCVWVCVCVRERERER